MELKTKSSAEDTDSSLEVLKAVLTKMDSEVSLPPEGEIDPAWRDEIDSEDFDDDSYKDEPEYEEVYFYKGQRVDSNGEVFDPDFDVIELNPDGSEIEI